MSCKVVFQFHMLFTKTISGFGKMHSNLFIDFVLVKRHWEPVYEAWGGKSEQETISSPKPY